MNSGPCASRGCAAATSTRSSCPSSVCSIHRRAAVPSSFVRAGTEAATLAPLPVRKLPGIGPVAEAKLNAAGICTLGELVDASEAVLRPIFGSYTASVMGERSGAVKQHSDSVALTL